MSIIYQQFWHCEQAFATDLFVKHDQPYKFVVCVNMHQRSGAWDRVCSAYHTPQLWHSGYNSCSADSVHRCTNPLPLHSVSLCPQQSQHHSVPSTWVAGMNVWHQGIKFIITQVTVQISYRESPIIHTSLQSTPRNPYKICNALHKEAHIKKFIHKFLGHYNFGVAAISSSPGKLLYTEIYVTFPCHFAQRQGDAP